MSTAMITRRISSMSAPLPAEIRTYECLSETLSRTKLPQRSLASRPPAVLALGA
jgi:hypothetical protein